MSEVQDWGLIGYGNIGQELARQVAQEEVAERLGLSQFPAFVVRSSGHYEGDGKTPLINDGEGKIDFLADLDGLSAVNFIALPSTNDGTTAFTHIASTLSNGSIAVTAEKGAMANYFSNLRGLSDNFSRLGYTASVGGGTRMLEAAQIYTRDKENIAQMHLVLNGTLNAIMSAVAPPGGTGMSLGQAVHQAVKLGYAEPGVEDAYDVMRQEAEGDVPKKTSILFNALGLGETEIKLDDFYPCELEDKDLAKVIEEASTRRFIVSIYPDRYKNIHGRFEERGLIKGFEADFEGWHIVGGFRNIERNPLFSYLSDMTGPANGMVIGLGPNEQDGVYALKGPGAGPEPTVNTMLDDYLRLKQLT